MWRNCLFNCFALHSLSKRGGKLCEKKTKKRIIVKFNVQSWSVFSFHASDCRKGCFAQVGGCKIMATERWQLRNMSSRTTTLSLHWTASAMFWQTIVQPVRLVHVQINQCMSKHSNGFRIESSQTCVCVIVSEIFMEIIYDNCWVLKMVQLQNGARNDMAVVWATGECTAFSFLACSRTSWQLATDR